MFAYSDPTGIGILERERALQNYRQLVHTLYRQEARKANSAFTLLSAFDDLHNDPETIVNTVDWAAFPKISKGTDAQIDADRFRHQDEYIEWRVEHNSSEQIVRITFTTELFEGFQALAEVGESALVRAIQDIIPAANPSTVELFGPGFNPSNASADARGQQFVFHRTSNPWNNGKKGILCLGQQNNTMEALLVLVGDCGVNRLVDPAQVCALSSCVPGRNSDPSVCAAVQQLAQSDRVISLVDPVGIRILELRGIWKRNGQQIDINDATQHSDVWSISRNGRRAVLNVGSGLTMGDDPIVSGAQVARALFVGASVISAPSSKLPAWAKTGHESSRVIV
jgi:hypothetical protein